MFRYELVNSKRKFTIVAEIVSLLKKIYKRDAPFRAVFSPYPREMKHTAKLKSAAILAFACFNPGLANTPAPQNLKIFIF